jgi:tellurite resistance protein
MKVSKTSAQKKRERVTAAEKAEAGAAAARAGQEQFMEAMIAACAIVAHADGELDGAERRRVFRLMRALPQFETFSGAEVAAEFERQEQAFTYDPHLAKDRALDLIEFLQANPREARQLLDACQHVLEADGVRHPREYAALAEIARVIKVSE